jgi:hypothetical protein
MYFPYDMLNFRGNNQLVRVDYNTVDSSPSVVIYLHLIVTLFAHFIYTCQASLSGVMSSFGECAPTRYTGMTAVAVIIHS